MIVSARMYISARMCVSACLTSRHSIFSNFISAPRRIVSAPTCINNPQFTSEERQFPSTPLVNKLRKPSSILSQNPSHYTGSGGRLSSTTKKLKPMGNKYQYNRKTCQAHAIHFAKHPRINYSSTNTIAPTDLLSEITQDNLRELTKLNKLYPVHTRVYFC
jgi:hypothetical protein